MATDKKTRSGSSTDNSTIPKGPRAEASLRSGGAASLAGLPEAARRGVPGLALPVLGKGRWVVVSVRPLAPPKPKSRSARGGDTTDNSTIPKGPRVEIVYEWEED